MSATRATPVSRASWHRRVGALPLAYLAAVVMLGFAHPLLPTWRWLAIHLLLLGAATNAILVWSAHFTAAILRVPTPVNRRAEAARLVTLNVGVAGVLVGGTADRPWVGVAGAAVVFGAVAAHLGWLARRVRAALPAPLTVTVHYYLAACVALLSGVPVGAAMLVDGGGRPRLLLFHAHVNLLGWITLTVLGTLLMLWPTVLRTRMVETSIPAGRSALPTTGVGLALLAIGVLAWWKWLAVGGVALFAVGVALGARPMITTAGRKAPASFAAWSIAAACGWLAVALGVDAWTLLGAADPAAAAARFDAVLVPLLVGFVAQVLIGSLAFLLPVVLGGGPVVVRERTDALDRHWPQRVAMANAALAVFVLPTPPYVRIATSLLVLAALLQFLVPAIRLLLAARR
ncbi:hypothetical protein GCM10009682_57480 [Luedemannella flava]|uniref:Copper oxidase n=1 Tax=Luedemannella flava TaxID=349316 RepID=A0ABN2MLC4_9ACTN